MRDDLFEKSLCDSATCRKSAVVLFVGSPLIFNDWILRVAASESDDLDVRRHEDLASADPARLAREGALRLVVVEESHFDELARRLGEARQPEGPISWVLAYRNPALAREVLRQRQEGGPLQEVRLLPMNAPIGVWASMFRLTLWGDFFVPCELLARRAEAAPPAPAAVVPTPALCEAGLTPRETEVLELVARGGQNKVIAHRLGLSEHTVKLHIHRIITKVGVRNRTAAARWYLSRVAAPGL
ncbi:LuxR C-terminal-related transcriptional regulator [Cereibacter sphaeroides]|uniref:helix-turn-helix transcriptional regulator n=1 Tax=Rhodobacterales TaxID=204455 RepID=UPI000BBF3ACF|nr:MULTISPECIES: LuxR C-terminal-related transcriptional regulator [Paracoccaceae]MCE6958667.1 LuxR C-terminal-related transcriptional regulator [Cereibacter sphaeroides]MCE6973450.1 LuxR C-terminal-related transcriptional regulator [Cereibacter sphaeroides]